VPTIRSPAAARLAGGVVLVLVAVVVFAAARLLAAGQRHAYDPSATPPPTYQLSRDKVYQLSSDSGVKELTKAGVLVSGAAPTCFASTDGGVQNPLSIISTKDDDRDLHLFATFQISTTGSFHISCTGINRVFVDDADDSPSDISAALIILATVLAVCGVLAALSGGYSLRA
jgi:hypothetical protein